MHDRCSPGILLKLVFVPFFLPMLSQHDAHGGKRQISPTTFSTHYLQKNMVLPWALANDTLASGRALCQDHHN
jgi:hypothetical protein